MADAGFGDAEDAADLGEGEVLEVVEGDDDAVALGEMGDGLGELAAVVLVNEEGGRVG